MSKVDWKKYDKKYNTILLKFNDTEYQNVLENAEKVNLKPTTFAKNIVLSKNINPIKSKVDKELITEIRRIGVNINQISKAINLL